MMKQLRYFCTLLLLAVVSLAWGDNVTDVLNQEFTGITGTSYSEWSGKTGTSGAVYAGQCAGGNESIQLRSNNNNSGVVTTSSGGKVKKITITWNSSTTNGRTLNVYGKKSAYTAATDLYNTSSQGTLIGTIVCGTSTELTIGDDYEYIGFRSASGAMYLSEVQIEWEPESSDKEESDFTITSSNTVSLVLPDNSTSQITYTTSSTGVISFESTDVTVATVSDEGLITAVSEGTATIKVSQASDDNYKASEIKEIVVNVEDTTQPTTITATLNNTFFGCDAFATTTEAGEITEVTGTKNNVTISYNYNSGNGYYCGTHIRIYSGTSLTFTAPEGYSIIKLVFTAASSTWGGLTTETNTYDNDTKTWEGYAQTVSFSASARSDVASVVITLQQEGEKQPSDFTITSPTTVNLELPDNKTATVTYTTSSTGTISWSSDNEDVAKVANGVITAVAEGSTTISVSQAADADYEASEEFTITVNVTGEAAPLANIAELTAQEEDGEYQVTLTDALVTYVNGTNGYIEDASGAVMLYGAVGDLAAGDKISGTATVTYTVYKGLPEVKDLTLADGYTKTTGNEVTPTVVTIAELTGDNYTSYLSRYVKIEKATVVSAFASKNSTIKQGEATIVLRDQNSSATLETTVNNLVTVTAHPAIYNTTKQIAVYEQSQIVVEVDERDDPGFAFNPTELNITKGEDYDAPEFDDPEGLTDDIVFTTSAEAVASWDATNGLVLGGANGTAVITATFEGNDYYLPGTATLTVTVTETIELVDVVEGCGIYERISSADGLEAGRRYLIVGYKTSETAYYAYNGFDEDTSKKYGLAAVVTVENDRIDNTESAATPVVLQAYGDNWFIMDGDNFLAYNLPAGTTNNNNLFAVSEATSVGTSWTIDYESENGYLITNAYNTERSLEFNSDRFACYLHSQQDVVLYKELLEVPVLIGDVNKDGEVTIADVTALVNILLDADGSVAASGNYDLQAADVDGENGITVADVNALVNLILTTNNE